jgi:YfiH family protein
MGSAGVIRADSLSDLRHGFFTRRGGVSTGLYASRNCGFGSGDDRAAVADNRERCRRDLGGGTTCRLLTVHQAHSTTVAVATEAWTPEEAPRADAMVTNRPGLALGILTADCAPILFADADAAVVGAAHAGWRGAFGGVIEATVEAMVGLGARPARIRAAIGPCIGPGSYEVGPEFRERFVAREPTHARLFRPAAGATDRRLFDLPAYIAVRLAAAGVSAIEALPYDTLPSEDLFFSYRRTTLRGERDYGRQIAAIVLG